MPYRRLPNTDQSRIRAITTALEQCGSNVDSGLVIDEKTLKEASTFLPSFEHAQHDYLLSLEKQKVASKKYYNQLRMARLYISHFIQVLNFCVLRTEIKRENKKLYGLEPDVHTVPDLNSETAILSWGEKIIKGERDRIAAGGPPIYNPTIAKVTVYYEVFRDICIDQKMHQKNTNRFLDQLASMRHEGDVIILDIWNQVEACFERESEKRRLELCEQYGVRYYLRKSEKSDD